MDQPPNNNMTQHEPESQSGLPQNADTLSSPQNDAIGLAKRLCAELIAMRAQNAALKQQLAEKNETIEKMRSGYPQSFLATVNDNASLKRQLTEMTERHQRPTAEQHQQKNPGQKAQQEELDYLRGRVRQLDSELRQLKAFLFSASHTPFSGGPQEQIPHSNAPQVPSQAGLPSRGQSNRQQPYLLLSPQYTQAPVYAGDQSQHQWAPMPQRQPTQQSSQMGAAPHLQLSPEQLGMLQLQQHGLRPEGRSLPQPLRIDTNRTFYDSSASGQWPLQGPVSASPTLGRHYVPPSRSGTLIPAVWGPTQSPVTTFPSKRRHLTPTTSHLAAQVIDLTLDETESAVVHHPAKRRRTDPEMPLPAPETQIPANARPGPPSSTAPAPPTELPPASDGPLMDQHVTTLEPQKTVADEDIPKEWEDEPVIMAFLEQTFLCDDGNPSQKKCYFCSERHVADPEAWPAESINSPTTGQMVEHIKDIHPAVWQEVVQMRDSPVDNEGE